MNNLEQGDPFMFDFECRALFLSLFILAAAGTKSSVPHGNITGSILVMGTPELNISGNRTLAWHAP